MGSRRSRCRSFPSWSIGPLPERFRFGPEHAFLAGLLILLVGVFPWVIDALLAALGVRGVAAGVFGLGLVSFFAAPKGVAEIPGFSAVPRLGFLGLAALAVATGDRLWLLLLPALAHAVVCLVFASSLRGPESLIERAAHVMHPFAPDFIRPYCRKVTAVWAALFGFAAVGTALLGILAPLPWWQAATGWQVWAGMVAAMAVEFAIRKVWFRYSFGNGPIERFFRRTFPPEKTAQGRRSLEYVRHMRKELGMSPP